METDRIILHLLPARTDNYIYVLHDKASGATIAVDPADAAPVLADLQQHNWQLNYILNTHHHHDHVGGNIELKERTGAEIIGYAGDRHRLPSIDRAVEEGNEILLGPLKANILFIPGHTLGHIAYHFAEQKLLFCGDTLFSLGCGRLYEGTPGQMTASLEKIMRLPADTIICCGHEYTQQNGAFALTVDPGNEALKAQLVKAKKLSEQGRPTLPTTLGDELAANPFLRTIQGDINLSKNQNINSTERFKILREMKDRF